MIISDIENPDDVRAYPKEELGMVDVEDLANEDLIKEFMKRKLYEDLDKRQEYLCMSSFDYVRYYAEDHLDMVDEDTIAEADLNDFSDKELFEAMESPNDIFKQINVGYEYACGRFDLKAFVQNIGEDNIRKILGDV